METENKLITDNSEDNGQNFILSGSSQIHLTPHQIVAELDKFIIGQDEAKKSVAIALRNRWRRQQVQGNMRNEIMPNNIIMIGPTGVGKTEIARRLACASIWALPSRGENFGMAVVEAMAAGLPVITTPEVNIAPEAYENGALLMTDGTAEAFATGILNLHRNPELSSRFGKAAAAYASRYLAENLAVDYLNLYRAHIR